MGLGSFRLIGCKSLSPSLALPTSFNNNTNNNKNNNNNNWRTLLHFINCPRRTDTRRANSFGRIVVKKIGL